MTAPRDPDDLASALLDGLLSDDEAAVARRDPAVVARLAELAAVREAVRRPPTGPDPVARERGLAAALAAFEAGDDPAEQRGAGAVGSTVSAGGRRRPAERPAAGRTGTPWRPRGTAGRHWLTAAAVVLAVVGLGVLVSNWDTGGDTADNAAQGGSADSDDAGGGSGSATAEEESEGGTTEQRAAPTVAPAGIVDLGDVDSSEALAERARSALAAGSSSPLSEASGGQDPADAGADGGALRSQCVDAAGAARLPATGETIVLEARATLDGDSVDVLVLATDGKERVVAVDATCEVVVDRPLG
jgi:hypothetical protein